MPIQDPEQGRETSSIGNALESHPHARRFLLSSAIIASLSGAEGFLTGVGAIAPNKAPLLLAATFVESLGVIGYNAWKGVQESALAEQARRLEERVK